MALTIIQGGGEAPKARPRSVQTNFGPISEKELQLLDDINAIATSIGTAARDMPEREADRFVSAQIARVLAGMLRGPTSSSESGQRFTWALGQALRSKVRTLLDGKEASHG